MTFIKQDSGFERTLWGNVPKTLESTITTLDELKKQFPATEQLTGIDIVRKNSNYIVYGRRDRKSELPELLAYACTSCNNLIMGPPLIHDDAPKIQGYHLHCTRCDNYLDKYFSYLRQSNQ